MNDIFPSESDLASEPQRLNRVDIGDKIRLTEIIIGNDDNLSDYYSALTALADKVGARMGYSHEGIHVIPENRSGLLSIYDSGYLEINKRVLFWYGEGKIRERAMAAGIEHEFWHRKLDHTGKGTVTKEDAVDAHHTDLEGFIEFLESLNVLGIEFSGHKHGTHRPYDEHLQLLRGLASETAASTAL